MSPSVSSQPALDQNKKAPARRVPSGGEIIQSSCALTSAADNAAALCQLAEKLDRHAATVAAIRPAVAALEVSRSKLARDLGLHRLCGGRGARLDRRGRN
jgi:hypothetical protein